MLVFIKNTWMLETLGKLRGKKDVSTLNGTFIALLGTLFSIALIRVRDPWDMLLTMLHEYNHYWYMKKVGFFAYIKDYRKQSKLHGYWGNKYEGRARRAEAHVDRWVFDWYMRNYSTKQALKLLFKRINEELYKDGEYIYEGR